jgi:hypothetical protein
MTVAGLGRGFGGDWCGEVAGGNLEHVGEEAGSFQVHAVGGEQGGEGAEGLLDGGAIVEVRDVEGFVFVHRRDDLVAVGEARVVVVHGAGSAAASVLVIFVHALVWDGWLSPEVVVSVGHGGPRGYLLRFC